MQPNFDRDSVHNGAAHETRRTVAAGATLVHICASAAPCTVAVHPAEGASAFVELSCSPRVAIADGAGLYFPAAGLGENGTVTASAGAPVPTPVNAVRVTATGGDVIVEILQ